MKNRYSWHSCDTISSELCQLLAIRAKDIDKSVHIADTKLLDSVMGMTLPLRAETKVRVVNINLDQLTPFLNAYIVTHLPV